jgi:CRISPR-associated protein Csb2
VTAIELRFLTNRYHGTAWGRHVNEGVPEWPPSPYRLFRAMFDAWKRKCDHIPEGEVRDLLTALAEQPPIFRLPKAVAAHTRSYLSSNTGDYADKSLIFDAFVSLPRGESCFLEWPIELTSTQRITLAELLAALNYLGRSESWVEASLATQARGGEYCAPASASVNNGEFVTVACAMPAADYSGKPSWLDVLAYSTGDMLRERRSSPPAMRTVLYSLPDDAVSTWLSPVRRVQPSGISALVLELHARVLPLATDTIRIAEQVRAALMSKAHNVPAVFHGKDEFGKPLKDHSHLFILPQADDLGRINRILLFSRKEPLKYENINTILKLQRLTWLDGSLRVAVTWTGTFNDPAFRHPAESVFSTTPFVTARHWRKGRGRPTDFLIEEVRRECDNHGLPKPRRIEHRKELASHFLPVHFRRNRKDDSPRPGYAFRIEFPEPVPVPFTLGYGCHFGLGQFDAA